MSPVIWEQVNTLQRPFHGTPRFVYGQTHMARPTRLTCSLPSHPRSHSFDEVGLVYHASRLAARDADEDASVHPGEIRGGGLDLGCGAECVLSGVDVLTTPETCEDLGAAVAHTT